MTPRLKRRDCLLGALVRGHKGGYEILHIFGDADDQPTAARLFDRAATMSETLLGEHGHATRWALPAEVRFEEGGAVAATEIIDVAAQWRLVHQLSGGFSILREGEGTSALMGEDAALGGLDRGGRAKHRANG